MRRFALAIALATFAVPALARANGRFPAANQMVASPRNPDELVLRATFGVLFSRDRGKTWDWVCERAIGYGNVWDPPMGVFSSGAVMAGTIDGLALSSDFGCAWAFVGGALEKRAIIDVVVRPDAPAAGLALASSNAGKTDAGVQRFDTLVFNTTDNGGSWALLSQAFDPTFTAQTLEVAKSDPKRLYVSGSVGERGVVYVSLDGGLTFEDRTFPLEKPAERHPFISAVDPTNADRFYVRTSGTTTRLLVTDDAGKTYRTLLTGPPLLGFALAPDGQRVWAGSTEGLMAANTTDFVFERIGRTGIGCLLATESALYACITDTTSPYAVGVSTDGGRNFSALLALKAVRGPLACPASAAASVCVEDWPSTRLVLDPPPAETDAGRPTPPANPAGLGTYRAEGGCSEAGASLAAPASWAFAPVALGVWLALRIAKARRLRSRTRPSRESR